MPCLVWLEAICIYLFYSIKKSPTRHELQTPPFYRRGAEALGEVLGAQCWERRGPCSTCPAPHSSRSPLLLGTLQSCARRRPGHLDTHSVLDCLCNPVFPEKYLDVSLGTSREGPGWHPENLLGARNHTSSSLLTAVPLARRQNKRFPPCTPCHYKPRKFLDTRAAANRCGSVFFNAFSAISSSGHGRTLQSLGLPLASAAARTFVGKI